MISVICRNLTFNRWILLNKTIFYSCERNYLFPPVSMLHWLVLRPIFPDMVQPKHRTGLYLRRRSDPPGDRQHSYGSPRSRRFRERHLYRDRGKRKARPTPNGISNWRRRGNPRSNPWSAGKAPDHCTGTCDFLLIFPTWFVRYVSSYSACIDINVYWWRTSC